MDERSPTAADPVELAARAGDPQAFGQLLRRHDDRMRGLVWSVVRDHDAVDDVLQVAYEKAFRAVSSFDGRSSLSTWLHTICYRTAVDHLRALGRRRRHEVQDPAEMERRARQPDRLDDRMALGAALDRLRPESRALLMLTAVVGLAFDEVAEITGLPRGTVASRVSRAREQLRREVGR